MVGPLAQAGPEECDSDCKKCFDVGFADKKSLD